MSRLFIYYLVFFITTGVVAQVDPYKSLNDQIGEFNNSNKHEESIRLLETIILDDKSKPMDLYNAYFMKYTTYKRIFNYTEALANLELALKYGLKCQDEKKIRVRIDVEKLFLYYDQQQFDNVKEILKRLSGTNLDFLPPNTHALYLSVLGSMATKAEKYEEAEKYLDEALVILHKHNPMHLPLIYRKKIDLNRRLNRYDKSIENFEKGLYYAEKYNIDVYIIGMYMDISTFYSRIGDTENALRTQHKINELNTFYDNTNKSGKLHQVEKELLTSVEKSRSKKNQFYFFIFSSISLLGLGILYFLYNSGKKKRLVIQEKNKKIQNELDKVSFELEEVNANKIDGKNYNLTERQLEIIDLVKQGKTNKEIGAQLFVSENTVKYHLKIIFETVGISKRTDLLNL